MFNEYVPLKMIPARSWKRQTSNKNY